MACNYVLNNFFSVCYYLSVDIYPLILAIFNFLWSTVLESRDFKYLLMSDVILESSQSLHFPKISLCYG